MKKSIKYSNKLAFMFSLSVFVIMSVTLMIIGSIFILIYKMNFIGFGTPIFPIMFFVSVSTILGTFFSRLIGKRVIQSIQDISLATIEIGSGNFDVYLNPESPIEEVSIMAENFNRMAKELNKIEILGADFINNVSHEFKTPVSAIEGYTTLLQNKDLSEEVRSEYIEHIIYNTQRLSSLVSNVLDLSRLENNQMTLTKESFLLDEQIRQVILSLEYRWSQKEIELDIDLMPMEITGNRHLLYQVWENILLNAIKFMDTKGYLRVRLYQDQNQIVVSIQDNGMGIEAENLHRIFDRFFQSDKARHLPGNGLGLSLVKMIIDLHGGSLDVTSQQGVGSEFIIRLPLNTED